MKKYIGILSIVLLSTLSCVDTRYDSLVDDTIYFVKSELQEQKVIVMSSSDYVYPMWVLKGGYFQEHFEGKVEVDIDYLDTYNTTNSTNYTMLDQKYFTFEPDFTLPKGQSEVAVPLTFKTDAIIAELGFGVYYVSMKVISTTDGKIANPEKANILVACEFAQASLSIDGTNKGEQLIDLSEETAATYTVDITAALDVESSEPLEVQYAVDPTLLPAGALLMDNAYFSFEENLTVPLNESYAENFITLQLSSMPNGRWTVPVRLSSTNSKIKVADDAFIVLTVIKGKFDAVTWASDYLQDELLYLPGEAKTNVIVGTTTNTDVEVSADATWVRPTLDGNTIKISVDVNPETADRSTILRVKDKATLLESTITVSQTLTGFGLVVNKASWQIIANSANCEKNKNSFLKMYDGLWRKNKDEKDSFTELNGRANDSDPYVLTFDMGAVRSCNSFGFMPRQQWNAPSPKRVKVEVSNDGTTWKVVGKNQGIGGVLPGYNESELKINGTFENHYNAKVKWFDFETKEEVRYFRVSFYETFWPKVLCAEEVFMSLR